MTTTTKTKTKKPMRRRLGRDLAALRQGAGVTQAKLAEASSIPLGSIQAMETGRFNPSLDHIRSYLALEAPERAPLESQLRDIRGLLEELLVRVGTPAEPLVEVKASEPASASASEWNVVATFTLAGCDVEVRTLEALPGTEEHTGTVWRSTNREHLFSPYAVSGKDAVPMACRDAIRAIAEELTGPLPLHCPFWTEVPLIVPHQDGTYPPGALEYPYVKVASTDTGWVAEVAISGDPARACGPTVADALIPLLLVRAGVYEENAGDLQGYNLKFDDTTVPPTVTATPCDEVGR